jgi:hypothetical protein
VEEAASGGKTADNRPISAFARKHRKHGISLITSILFSVGGAARGHKAKDDDESVFFFFSPVVSSPSLRYPPIPRADRARAFSWNIRDRRAGRLGGGWESEGYEPRHNKSQGTAFPYAR